MGYQYVCIYSKSERIKCTVFNSYNLKKVTTYRGAEKVFAIAYPFWIDISFHVLNIGIL